MKESRYSCDVLILGGSLAGFSTAIQAKEENPDADILIVEKYTSGYSGKANRGACMMLTLNHQFTPEEFLEFHVKYNGDYLNDQEVFLDYASKTELNVERLDKWSGGKFSKISGKVDVVSWGGQFDGYDENGKPIEIESPLPWVIAGIDNDYMLYVRKYAEKLGIRIVDRVGFTDLLTKDDAVIGAMGFKLDTMERVIFSSRITAICTGNQNWRMAPMWGGGRGEGILAAWRAGAKMANCEFGTFTQWTSPHNFEAVLGAEVALYNSKGENIGLGCRRPQDSDVEPRTISSWYKNMVAGNGPIEYREEENLHEKSDSRAKIFFSTELFDRPKNDKFWGELIANTSEGEHFGKVECVPMLIGEHSPIWVDHRFKTSLKNLYAAGESCTTGSCLGGAVPPPTRTRGGGLSITVYEGTECGISIAEDIKSADPIQEPSMEQIERYTAEFLAPLDNADGFAPSEVLDRIHNIMNDMGRVIYKSADRLADSLTKVHSIQKSLPYIKARDVHELFEVNELRAMVLSSDLFFRTSFIREETRGWQVREDFPDHDDANWLKWIMVEKDGDDMKISYEPIPIDRYPVQP